MHAEPPAEPRLGTPAHEGSALARSFSFDPATIELFPAPLDPAQIVEGNPRVAERVMWSSPDGRRHRGVWEHTAGVSTDVEVDEVFIVVSGRATIEVEGGSTLEVGPGDVGILEAGARTRWRVHETVRKVFHVDDPDADVGGAAD